MQNGQNPVGGVPLWYLGVTIVFLLTLGLL